MNDMGFSGMREPLYGWIAPALTVGEKSLREEAGDPLKDLKKDLDKSGKTAKDILIEGMKELMPVYCVIGKIPAVRNISNKIIVLEKHS